MIVWTIRSEKTWQQLERDKVLYGPPVTSKSIEPSFLTAYDWMMTQMEQRLGPRPQRDRYPLWAWYQWENAKQARPDLRSGGHLKAGTRGVRIEFEIDEQEMLLSDFDLWNEVLNAWYIGADQEDEDAFEDVFESVCQTDGRPEAVSRFRESITSSWERVFDLDHTDEGSLAGARRDKTIQGTFWFLRLDQVRAVKTFTAR